MNTEEDFKREFRELLRKYNVDMSIQPSNNNGYYEEYEVNFFRYDNLSDEGLIDWNTRWEDGAER